MSKVFVKLWSGAFTVKNSTAFWKNKGQWILEMGVLFAVFAVFAFAAYNGVHDHSADFFARETIWEKILLYAGIFAGVVPVFYLIFQAVLVCFYRPVYKDNVPDEELPGCTVVVPAYNEGSAVAETLRALLKSDYPAEKLEIIAINDGSADDTWNWMTLAAGEADGRIKTINLEQNKGKKNALYIGFNQAKHDIVVTIDSDSFVKSDTIRNLVMPFDDPKVGGSAGVVRVRNVNRGMIPRILDVCFVFSCDFIRSAQSAIGAVLCSPGAISAYRKAALLPHLDGWLHQTFLGKPSTIGEDRALTSILLRNDYHVVLQNTALVETCVPENYPQLCRTLIRWTRGDVREGLLMIRHFYKRFSFGDWRLTALKINLGCQLLGLMLPVIMFPLMIFTFVSCAGNIMFVVSYLIFATWLWAMIPAVLYANRETPLKAAWAFISALYSLFALSWVCFYSWITMNNPGWMTRSVPKDEEMKKTAVRGVHGN